MRIVVVVGGEGVALLVEGAEGEAEWTSINYQMNLSFKGCFLHIEFTHTFISYWILIIYVSICNFIVVTLHLVRSTSPSFSRFLWLYATS